MIDLTDNIKPIFPEFELTDNIEPKSLLDEMYFSRFLDKLDANCKPTEIEENDMSINYKKSEHNGKFYPEKLSDYKALNNIKDEKDPLNPIEKLSRIEFEKCRDDVTYFAENYVKSIDTSETFKKALRVIEGNKKSLLELYGDRPNTDYIDIVSAVHHALFFADKNVYILSQTTWASNNVIQSICDMLKELPEQFGTASYSRLDRTNITLKNGSKITAHISNDPIRTGGIDRVYVRVHQTSEEEIERLPHQRINYFRNTEHITYIASEAHSSAKSTALLKAVWIEGMAYVKTRWDSNEENMYNAKGVFDDGEYYKRGY